MSDPISDYFLNKYCVVIPIGGGQGAYDGDLLDANHVTLHVETATSGKGA